MGNVSTNETGLAYAVEESLGVLPASPSWRKLQPNSFGNMGAEISTVARTPISADRQDRKGTTTDLDSAAAFAADMTLDHFLDFAEAFTFARFTTDIAAFTPTAAVSGGSGGYTVPSGGALPAGRLVYARGFTTAVNNGLKVVASGSTATNVRVDGLTAESAPTPNHLELMECGVQATSGDIGVDADGNLTSTTLDFTTLGLTVGQGIYIGGSDSANQFAQAANRGYARVKAISANLLTLDKRAQAYVTDTGTGKTIHIYFGRFLRNVPTSHADFIRRSYTFEQEFPNLASGGAASYEYLKGNYANQLKLNISTNAKITMDFEFVGTDTEPNVAAGSRKTNAASAVSPIKETAVNATSDIGRLRLEQVDGTGMSSYFKSLTLTVNNNVTPEKVVSVLGAAYLNLGTLSVQVEGSMLFTDPAVPAAIRNNTTVTLDFAMRNEDGAVLVDLPAVTLGGGQKSYPVNETVTIATTAMAHKDTTLGTSIGFTHFPFVPAT